jgi:hypothetical protein
MKLTSQEIVFIDNYLQKSDVIFIDIRAEMTDHIATAVEDKMQQEDLDFYDAFKDFMSVNKKEILSRNNSNFKYFQEAILSFSKTLYQPYNLVFAASLILIFYSLFSFFDEVKVLKTLKVVLFIGIFGFAIIQAIYTFIIIKKRYLYLEKTSFVLMVVYYIHLFSNGFYKEDGGNVYSIGITMFLFFAFLVHYFATVRKFRMKYI